MMMRLAAASLSAVVPKTSLGVNVASGTYLQFRIGGATHIYGIAKGPSAGMNGTLGATLLDTEWFPVKNTKKRGKTIPYMNNMLAQLEVVGLVAVAGKIDLKFTLFNKFKEPMMVIERVGEPVVGYHAINFVVRGNMKLLGKLPNPEIKRRR